MTARVYTEANQRARTRSKERYAVDDTYRTHRKAIAAQYYAANSERILARRRALRIARAYIKA